MPSSTVNGAELHYDDLGSGDEVVVWVHGIFFSAALYHDVAQKLPGYRHVIVDLRGHGRSAAVSEGANLDQMADDVAELTLTLGVDRFFLVGHSLGNAVGMRVALRHPGRLRAGVSLAGVPLAGLPEGSREMTLAAGGLLGNVDGFAAMLGSVCVHEGNESFIKQGSAEMALVGAAAFDRLAVDLFLDQADEFVAAMTQPWLFVIPSLDAAIPSDAQWEGAQRVPGARIIWANGEGHLIPQERPAETAAWIQTFLALPGR
jgi:pimeloyl-ACP methyl ester carboxylesterase